MKTTHSYLLLLTALAIGPLISSASAQTYTWNAASGNWSSEEHWSPPADPNLPSVTVVFNNGGSLTLDGSRNIGIYSQTAGVFTIAQPESLVLAGSGTLAGGGIIRLGFSYISQNGGNVLFTNIDGAIQGYGEIGVNGLNVLNQTVGVIEADVAGQSLFLNGGGTFTNNGLIRARNGGRLVFDGSGNVVNNATIRAEDASEVRIQNLILGGGLDNAGSTGLITLNNGTLHDVTIAASSRVMLLADGRIENTLINHGTLSDESNANLVIGGDTTLSGGGDIKLGFGYLRSDGSNRILTNTDNILRGYGEIGVDSLNVVNGPDGIIQADIGGQTLILNGSGTFTNNGLVRSQNSGRLVFDGSANVINNATIRAEDASEVRIQNLILGGALDNAGSTGLITLNNGTLRDVTIAASSKVMLLADGRIENTLINHGTLSDESNANLVIGGDTTLSGGGDIKLGFGYLRSDGSNRTLTNTDNVLRGYGEIGVDSLNVVNATDGIIQADIGGQTLKLNGSGTFTNNGLVRSQSGGALTLDGSAGATFTNTGGTLQALDGTTVFGVQLTLIQSSGTIDLASGNMSFPLGVDLNGGQLVGNGTFTGPIRNNGGIVGPGHSSGKITVIGDYTQGANGTLAIEIGGRTAGTQYDQLAVNGIASLAGTLNVKLINGFRPIPGDVFQIITPTTFSGAFAAIHTTGFTGQVNYNAGAITVTVLTVPDIPLNISTRLGVKPDPNQLIGGVIITGTEPKKVLLRAIGPSLSGILTGALADPTLDLFQGSTLLESNDNWRDSNQAAIEATGIPPTNDLESAIVRTLDPGAYTAVMRGNGAASGIGLVEAYDLEQTTSSKLANISTRGFVEAADDAMIGGFILGGNGGENGRVVIRAIGPSLGAFGIEDALQDPVLELHDANGSTLMTNDDWQSAQQAEIEATGLAPTDTHEAAIVTSLLGGSYTSVVRGKNNTTGVGLVEVYHVD